MRVACRIQWLIMLLFVGAVRAEELPLALDPNSDDGRLVLEIDEETDETKKLHLMEKFVATFSGGEGLAWVLAQLQPAYIKSNQLDKALDAGEKLIAIAPDHLEGVYNCLRVAEAKNDSDLVKKWALRSWQISKKIAALEKPAEHKEVETWKQRIEYASSVHAYSEYALYAAAVAAKDARKRIELLQELENRNPRSPYLSQVHSQYYTAFRQLGNLDQSVALAEKNAREGKADEDMLTLLTVHSHQRKDVTKTLFYASKVVEMLEHKKLPDNTTQAEWDKKRSVALGNAHYLTGIIYSDQDRFSEADRALRAALPFIKYDEYVRASALFHLAWANYRMGDQAQSPGLIKEALRFNNQCATIASPFRQQALKNLEAIKLEYDLK